MGIEGVVYFLVNEVFDVFVDEDIKWIVYVNVDLFVGNIYSLKYKRLVELFVNVV